MYIAEGHIVNSDMFQSKTFTTTNLMNERISQSDSIPTANSSLQTIKYRVRFLDSKAALLKLLYFNLMNLFHIITSL